MMFYIYLPRSMVFYYIRQKSSASEVKVRQGFTYILIRTNCTRRSHPPLLKSVLGVLERAPCVHGRTYLLRRYDTTKSPQRTPVMPISLSASTRWNVRRLPYRLVSTCKINTDMGHHLHAHDSTLWITTKQQHRCERGQ